MVVRRQQKKAAGILEMQKAEGIPFKAPPLGGRGQSIVVIRRYLLSGAYFNCGSSLSSI